MGRGQEVTSSRSGWGECGRHARQRGAHALAGQPRWGGDARGRPRGETAGPAAPRWMAGLAGARPCVLPPTRRLRSPDPGPRASRGVRAAGASSPGHAPLARSLARAPNCCSRAALRPARTRQDWEANGESRGDSVRKGWQVLASQQLSVVPSRTWETRVVFGL